MRMNPIELLTTVNDFYDKAFNKLLVSSFGIIAFIGVIIPIAVGWLQTRSLRSEKKSLLNELRSDLSSERDAVEKEIKEEVERQIKVVKDDYEKRFAEVTSSIEKSSASALARAHHLQANSTIDNSAAGFGLRDFCHAAVKFFVAGEEDNARRTLSTVYEHCLPKITSELYKEYDAETFCNDLIGEIKKNNTNNRYADDIVCIRKEMQNASIRTKAKS